MKHLDQLAWLDRGPQTMGSIHTERRTAPYAPRHIDRRITRSGIENAVALAWLGLVLVVLIAAASGHPL